jgi:hypothetical protein
MFRDSEMMIDDNQQGQFWKLTHGVTIIAHLLFCNSKQPHHHQPAAHIIMYK